MSPPALERYRSWLEASVHPSVLAWCPGAVRRRLEEASAEYLRRTLDDEHSQRYAQACPVAGVDHRQYRLRELHLTCGASLLAGIHFRGQDLALPFAGVFAQSRWLTSEELALAHRELMHELRVFSPRASWWWSALPEHAPALPTARTDQLLVMGSLAELRCQPAPELPAGWRLQRCNSASEIGAAFQALYRHFHEARPELAQVVPAAPLEELEACAQAGGLFACFAGADVAGIVAAQPAEQYSVRAWLMWDIVLAREHCGKGLAPVLQRAALDQLDPARAPLVAGTIAAENQPSLRTALRVGRRVVGSWTYLSDPACSRG